MRASGPIHVRGLGLDCVVSADGAAEAAPLFAALSRRDAGPDLASLRCDAPDGASGARAQVKELLALCAALAGTPVLRRGPVTAELLGSLKGAPVAGCEDGGAAAEAAMAVLPLLPDGEAPAAPRQGEAEPAWWDGAPAALPPPPARTPDELVAAEAKLSEGRRSRLEARAYLEVLDFLERLGAAGSAPRVARALEQVLAEPGA